MKDGGFTVRFKQIQVMEGSGDNDVIYAIDERGYIWVADCINKTAIGWKKLINPSIKRLDTTREIHNEEDDGETQFNSKFENPTYP